MKNKGVLYLTQAAVIAALYVALTALANAMGLASGAIQFRLSEALTILPCFTAAAIPGLAIGCFLANLLTGCVFWDIVFGTVATLIGAVGTWLICGRREEHVPDGKIWKNPRVMLAPLPPILANMVIVPWVLRFAYDVPDAIWYLSVTVGVGEIVCCGILGLLLYIPLDKNRREIFG